MRNFRDVPEESKEKIRKYVEKESKEHKSTELAEMVKAKFQIIVSERTVRNMLAKIRNDLDTIGETLEKAIEAVNEEEEKEYEIIEK